MKERGEGQERSRFREAKRAFFGVAAIGLLTLLVAAPIGEVIFVGGLAGAGVSQLGESATKKKK
jgi:hypothetical protein